VRLLPYGDRAVLVELDSLSAVHQLHRALQDLGLESVPGWSTLLVTSEGDVRALAAQLEQVELGAAEGTEPVLHEIPVTYDGEDLPAVAAAARLSEEQVVALHAAATYTVAFLGFSRGFPYLAGVPAQLQLPRRATPRVRVPAGSVAIAGEACGIYPAASSGGWHLLGRTDQVLFDPSATPPSRLAPGDLVRFVAT
jgi:KipI family sensor histidine kinase inhibitor